MRVEFCAKRRANINRSPFGSIIDVIVGRMPQQKVIMCARGKLQTVDRCWVGKRTDEQAPQIRN